MKIYLFSSIISWSSVAICRQLHVFFWKKSTLEFRLSKIVKVFLKKITDFATFRTRFPIEFQNLYSSTRHQVRKGHYLFYIEKICNFDRIEKALIEWFSFGPIYIYNNKKPMNSRSSVAGSLQKPLVLIRIMCDCHLHPIIKSWDRWVWPAILNMYSQKRTDIFLFWDSAKHLVI